MTAANDAYWIDPCPFSVTRIDAVSTPWREACPLDLCNRRRPEGVALQLRSRHNPYFSINFHNSTQFGGPDGIHKGSVLFDSYIDST